jgi:hypothetical protein
VLHPPKGVKFVQHHEQRVALLLALARFQQGEIDEQAQEPPVFGKVSGRQHQIGITP